MEKNFGTRVRQARHKAGLTQAALAEKLNLDETTIMAARQHPLQPCLIFQKH